MRIAFRSERMRIRGCRYREQIRTPRCFRDMREAVRKGSYTTWRQFTADFHLIVNNALVGPTLLLPRVSVVPSPSQVYHVMR